MQRVFIIIYPLSYQYFLGPINVVCLLRLLHIFKHTLEYFIMVANIMNPVQTAPEEAV